MLGLLTTVNRLIRYKEPPLGCRWSCVMGANNCGFFFFTSHTSIFFYLLLFFSFVGWGGALILVSPAVMMPRLILDFLLLGHPCSFVGVLKLRNDCPLCHNKEPSRDVRSWAPQHSRS